jgi:two-component system KDP operon response regulator KdpE
VRILLVDDDVSIQRAVAPLLRSRGYEVDVVGTGTEAASAVVDHAPDLVVLDLGLPDLEGVEVCRRIRKHSKMPIVILSARAGEAEKVAALDIGADDYVTKPFSFMELLARIRVALRRMADREHPNSGASGRRLTIDYGRHRECRGTKIRRRGVQTAALLARNADRVLTHRAIIKAIWGPTVDQPEHLWVLVGAASKIRPSGNPRYLLSGHWIGYRQRQSAAVEEQTV